MLQQDIAQIIALRQMIRELDKHISATLGQPAYTQNTLIHFLISSDDDDVAYQDVHYP